MKLWLRSQVEQVSQLEVVISGSDRQILSGYIPHVSISACHAVYQGLHLRQIQLVAENIRINLGQVLRGKPLRLLQAVPVFIELMLQELDLNASIKSPLLTNAMTQLLTMLLSDDYPLSGIVNYHKITINNGQLIINATIAANTNNPTAVIIRSDIQLASSHELQLEQLQIHTQSGVPIVNLNSFKLDLGTEVAIEELTLSSGQLICYGRINIIP